MIDGRVRAACRRIAGRSYRRRRAEMWASVYCAAFDVGDGEGGEAETRPAAADGVTPDSPRE